MIPLAMLALMGKGWRAALLAAVACMCAAPAAQAAFPGANGKIAYMSYPDGAKTINPDGTGDAVFDTTLDALVPGSVAEGSRTIQALGQVRVFDGGPDENADTAADNALLAVQGVFVP